MTDTPPRPAARRRSRFAQLIARIAAAVRAANAGERALLIRLRPPP